MIDNDVFFERPAAKAAFFKWFSGRNPRGYDLDMMPEFMAIPVIIAFLDSKGLYIDRETPSFSMSIWDYRDGEPEEPVYSLSNDGGQSMEEIAKICIDKALSLLCPEDPRQFED